MTGKEIIEASATTIQHKSKFTAEMLDTLLEAIADGLNSTQACAAVGIQRATLHMWVQRHPVFAQALEAAREKARRKALTIIKAAAETGDVRAAELWLRYAFYPEYAKPETSVKVGLQQQTLIVTEETRQRLQELQAKILKGEKKVEELPASPNQSALGDIERGEIIELPNGECEPDDPGDHIKQLEEENEKLRGREIRWREKAHKAEAALYHGSVPDDPDFNANLP